MVLISTVCHYCLLTCHVSPSLRVKSRLCLENTSTPLPASPTHSDHSAASTPTRSNLGDWSSCHLAQTPSSIHSNSSAHTMTPNRSLSDIANGNSTYSQHSSSLNSSQRSARLGFEPKNLLSLFEETTP